MLAQEHPCCSLRAVPAGTGRWGCGLAWGWAQSEVGTLMGGSRGLAIAAPGSSQTSAVGGRLGVGEESPRWPGKHPSCLSWPFSLRCPRWLRRVFSGSVCVGGLQPSWHYLWGRGATLASAGILYSALCHFSALRGPSAGAVASTVVKQKLAEVILKKQQAALERTSNPNPSAMPYR